MALEIGEKVIVPVNLILEVDGFENELSTKDEEAEVINRLEAGINTATGEQIFNYYLKFKEQFELLNEEGEVVQRIDSFWFSEDSLSPEKGSGSEQLPLTPGQINAALSSNKKAMAVSQRNINKILNSIPDGDPFKDPVESLNSIVSRNKRTVDSVKYNPNNTDSVNNIMADVEGTSLLAEDAATFEQFAGILKTQQEVVAGKTAQLQREEQQSNLNSDKTESNNSASVNMFLDRLPDLKGSEVLLLTSEEFTPVDWNKLEPKVPKASDVLPKKETPADKAARLFPLLDPKKVTSSDIIK